MTWLLSGFADEAGPTADEQIQAIVNAGLRHIDPRSIDNYNVAQLPLEQAKVIREKFDAAGIEAYILGTPIGKIDITEDFAPDMARLEHVAAVGKIFGTNRIRIFSYFNKHGATLAEWEKAALQRIGDLHRKAQDLELILYLENERHVFADRIDQVLAILNVLRDGKTFRSIFDFDNFNQGGDDCWENWLKLRDMTDAFHLKESDANGQHVAIGQGAGHSRKIFEDALSRGWSGSLSLEPHLTRSEAVLVTGPHGTGNQRLADMSAAETFQYAAEQAKSLFREINAPIE